MAGSKAQKAAQRALGQQVPLGEQAASDQETASSEPSSDAEEGDAMDSEQAGRQNSLEKMELPRRTKR